MIFFSRGKYKSFAQKWNECAAKTHDLFGAYSTQVYRESEINLFKQYFPSLDNKKLLKLDLWNEAKNTRILECLSKEGPIIYGIDISENITKAANDNFEKQKLGAKFLVGDVDYMPFKDNEFEYIYTMGTIEHTPYPHRSLKEIKRILKPGGIAIIGVPNRSDIFLRPIFVWFLSLFNMYPYSPEKSYTRRKLNRLIKEANLKIIDDSGILFMPGVLRMLELLVYKYKPALSLKLFSGIFRLFEKMERKYTWAKRNGYLIACVCKKCD